MIKESFSLYMIRKENGNFYLHVGEDWEAFHVDYLVVGSVLFLI